MMKNVTEFLSSKNYIFSSFINIEPREIGSRKKIKLYSACDIKNNYICVFIINQKSRFLIKNAEEILQLQQKLVIKEDHNYKKNIFIIQSAVCSKALKYLKDNSWIIYNDFV